jgi:carboxyl-terminal processing protease
MRVYDNSPASEADVQPGDIILAIDGDRRDWTPQEASDAIKRPVNEPVTIVWLRDGEEITTDMVVRYLDTPNISTGLDGEVGYLYMLRFNAQSTSELRVKIEELSEQGARAFVLDLRGDPGGLLDQAVSVTSLFVEEGVVVRIEDNAGVTVRNVSGDVLTRAPLVVLVNGGSASSSEIVCAALQDHGRATIVGEGTYGKGTVQGFKELSFGGAIKYTIAHYLSPDGTTIDGVGVTPDTIIADDVQTEADEQYDAAIAAARAML